MILKTRVWNNTGFGEDGNPVRQLRVVCIICCAREIGKLSICKTVFTTCLMPVKISCEWVADLEVKAKILTPLENNRISL